MKRFIIFVILLLTISCSSINTSCQAHNQEKLDSIETIRSKIPSLDYITKNCEPIVQPMSIIAFNKPYMIFLFNDCYEYSNLLAVLWGPELNDDEIILAKSIATYFRMRMEVNNKTQLNERYLGVSSKTQDVLEKGAINTIHMAFFELMPKSE
ncbi:hypothetical protein CMI47_12770 [Candidatus Pacearchaeota archaeon]|nr:hypothetical protein [Candidatus Pacearchaeota archaeon]|tara:strand:+ start:58635 stop:59093 length:459 start_codon:yes stop_codon:yes gene_type:complete